MRVDPQAWLARPGITTLLDALDASGAIARRDRLWTRAREERPEDVAAADADLGRGVVGHPQPPCPLPLPLLPSSLAPSELPGSTSTDGSSAGLS